MLIVSPNLGLERTLEIPELRAGEVLRFTKATVTAGGKGVNVARAAKALGTPATLVGFTAGHSGRAVADLIADEGLPFVPVATGGEARAMSVIIEASGRVTVLNEPGPPITQDEWQVLEDAVAGRLTNHRVLVCIGSVPPGTPADAYARLVHLAHARGPLAVVDAAGELLTRALAAQPDVVLPNVYEAHGVLAALAGDRETRDPVPQPVDVEDPATVRRQATEAADALVRHGARAAVVTAGAAGAALAAGDSDKAWIAAPRVQVGNPIGAGDAFAAGLAAALERGEALQEAARLAAAAAAASVETALPGHLDPARAAALLPQVTLQRPT